MLSGITDVWLPPAYKAASGKQDAGYGVYDLYDLGEFDQKGRIEKKYGTKDEYLKAIYELHKNNIKVYADIVLNHKMGADELEDVFAREAERDNRNVEEGYIKKIKAWTKYTFPGRHDKYSSFKWNYSHFNGADWDEANKENALFRFCGRHWDENVDSENGNYDYLMGTDIDFDNEEVKEELRKWGRWYINTTDIDGLRLDAVKHISATFMRDWVAAMREIKPLDCVGEYWNRNLDTLKQYIEKTERTIPLFDVPLHYNFFEASNAGGNYDMGRILEGTLVKVDPEMAVTFVDNHDTEPGQALFSFVQPWFKPLAYAIILLRKEGVPCIFYGDYYGIPSQGVKPMDSKLEKLTKARKYFAYGDQIDYFNDSSVVGFARLGDNEHTDSGLVTIMSDSNGGSKQINLGEKFANTSFYDYTGNADGIVTTDAFGNGNFYCNGGSVSVWVKCGNIYG